MLLSQRGESWGREERLGDAKQKKGQDLLREGWSLLHSGTRPPFHGSLAGLRIIITFGSVTLGLRETGWDGLVFLTSKKAY